MSALTHNQKRYLSQLSEQAFDRVAAESDGQAPAIHPELGATAAREAFRHEQVAAACGKLGLRCCGQDDYNLVKAHFLAKLGRDAEAFNAGVRAVTERRRQAEAVLVRECDRAGVRIGYAAAICRNVFKCSLDDAGPDQIWKVIYTVRNRARRPADAIRVNA